MLANEQKTEMISFKAGSEQGAKAAKMIMRKRTWLNYGSLCPGYQQLFIINN